MKLKPREQLLLGALAVVAIALGIRFLATGGDQGTFDALVERTISEDADAPVATLALAALEVRPGEYVPGRDPFRYGQPPRPPVVRDPTPPPPPRNTQVEPPRVVDNTPPKPALPRLDYTYLGSFGPEDRPIAVLTDAEDAIYNAFEGDVIDQQFRVEQIGYESVDVGYVNFPEEPPKRLRIGRK